MHVLPILTRTALCFALLSRLAVAADAEPAPDAVPPEATVENTEVPAPPLPNNDTSDTADTTDTAMTPTPPPQTAQTLSPAEQGRRDFLQYNCYGCHGIRGLGGIGPNLVGKAALVGSVVFTGTSTGMPSFRNVLPLEEVPNLTAYVGKLGQADEPTFTHWWEPVPTR